MNKFDLDYYDAQEQHLDDIDTPGSHQDWMDMEQAMYNELESVSLSEDSVQGLGKDKAKSKGKGKGKSKGKNEGKYYIRPLQANKDGPVPIGTFDLETVTMPDNSQLTVAISGCGVGSYFVCINKFIQYNDDGSYDSSELLKAHDLMWEHFFTYFMLLLPSGSVIYAHNFGGYDGVLTVPALVKYLAKSGETDWTIKPLIDDSLKYISISLQETSVEVKSLSGKMSTRSKAMYEFKDSHRVFPASLSALCKNIGVTGKTSSWNPLWNLEFVTRCPAKMSASELEEFNLFREYSRQDSTSLYLVLIKLQEWYMSRYSIELTTAYSLSSLAVRVYRTHFMSSIKALKLPMLIEAASPATDAIIRQSFYGGASDIYFAEGKDLHYYDINSLYPWAMTRRLPQQYEGHCMPMTSTLSKFFGFIKVEVTSPNSLVPLLPYRGIDGSLSYPVGKWVGWYFSEELKAAAKYGYKFKLLEGHKYKPYKHSPFTGYVQHFFAIKRNAENPTARFLSKMMLNQLYGHFARMCVKDPAVFTNSTQQDTLLAHQRVTSTIELMLEQFAIVLTKVAPPTKVEDAPIINEEDKAYLSTIFPSYTPTNVALASAITAYSRVLMMEYKTIPNNPPYYTDTDSVWLQHPIDSQLIGPGLGLMKDELGGKVASKFVALNVKQYAYSVVEDGGVKDYSAFSGVTKNTLSVDSLTEMLNGGSIECKVKPRVQRNMTRSKLYWTIPRDMKLKHNPKKKLVNGVYYPPVVNEPYV